MIIDYYEIQSCTCQWQKSIARRKSVESSIKANKAQYIYIRTVSSKYLCWLLYQTGGNWLMGRLGAEKHTPYTRFLARTAGKESNVPKLKYKAKVLLSNLYSVK